MHLSDSQMAAEGVRGEGAGQRENRPGDGAAGKRLGNCGGGGRDGADCASVPSRLDASVESGIGDDLRPL